MLRTILIDDEDNCLDFLEYELEQQDIAVEVVAKCNDSRKAVALIENEKPDLVFLDIEMPWLSGFEVLDKLKFIGFHLVFVTAYNEYAIKAFRYFALDYLLKPVDGKLLKETLDQIQKQHNIQREDVGEIIDLLKNEGLKAGKIAFPTFKGYEFYNYDEIIRCEADSNYTKVFTNSGKSIVISKTLKSIEEMLDSSTFIRVHQSHLVNINHLVEYNKADGGELRMSDDSVVPLSRQRRQYFLDRIKKT